MALPYPFSTIIKLYKTCFNIKKWSYQAIILHKIINFAHYLQLLTT